MMLHILKTFQVQKYQVAFLNHYLSWIVQSNFEKISLQIRFHFQENHFEQLQVQHVWLCLRWFHQLSLVSFQAASKQAVARIGIELNQSLAQSGFHGLVKKNQMRSKIIMSVKPCLWSYVNLIASKRGCFWIENMLHILTYSSKGGFKSTLTNHSLNWLKNGSSDLIGPEFGPEFGPESV